MPYPYNEQEVLAFQSDVRATYQEAGQELNAFDDASVVWSARMTFDAVAMNYPASRSKHLSALKAQLGIKPPLTTMENLVTAGEFFRLESGAYFTAVECSDFSLLARWQNGEDITPVLAQRQACGFNMLRVWTAFDIPGIGTFTNIDYAGIPDFVTLCSQYGLYVEFTAYTGINDPQHWPQLVNAALACSIRPLLELVNELDQNTNEPDSQGRIFNLEDYDQAPAPLLSSHGSNGSQACAVRPWWSYEEFHTNDAPEWQRKVGHNAMELAHGTPDYPPSHSPVLSNENTRFCDKPDTTVERAYDSAAGAALLCAGSCYHSVAGKTSTPWPPDEQERAQAWASGARSVDLICQDGHYYHANELETEGILRAYQRVLPSGQAVTVLIRV